MGHKMITSTHVHPQANDQAESSNKIIINNIKKNLGSKKGKWAEELPFVLWADRTTTKNATGQTPFSLVFGSEAVLPTEMIIPTTRTSLQTIEANNEDQKIPNWRFGSEKSVPEYHLPNRWKACPKMGRTL
ncbi:hypothetical protein E3N88_35066 [Mikania micrantha]|uniref:Integrase catalytic domain-containing protein n=1 Tax=Mikania micrantha TaxID=192012 RepID=A0A5N6M0V4_9ASTR|nr:hypothetical protein E3N88_35066 [Mikania micrantha]